MNLGVPIGERDERLPPEQRLTEKFPIFTVGKVPSIELSEWSFSLEANGGEIARWNWEEFRELPETELCVDIHCVTHWTRPDTRFRGVTVDGLLEAAGLEPPSAFAMAHCFSSYTTNFEVRDLLSGRALVAFEIDGEPLTPEHGAPARLVVPHLYFWKSAKWIRSLRFMEENEPGMWEARGYHMRGDPWKNERHEPR